MTSKFSELSFDLTKYIFSFLSEKELFQIERVSKKFQKCILFLLAKKKSLKSLDYYSSKFKNHKKERFIIDDKNININILKNILKKYPNLKHIDLSNTNVVGDGNLIAIVNLVPKLESLDLTGTFKVGNTHDLNEFAKIVGPKLIRCKFGCNFNKVIFIISMQMKIIEEIEFEIFDDEKDTEELFKHLNINCQNLKSFGWLRSNRNLNIDYQDINFVNVMQRINRLDIELSNLTKITFKMDNLIELTLHGLDYDAEIKHLKFKNLTFTNLRKLKINQFFDYSFVVISKLKFPQLEIVSIDDFIGNIPSSFVNQIKQVKSLEFSNCDYFNPEILSKLKFLNNFVCAQKINPDHFSDCFLPELFHALAAHKSVKNIKVEFVGNGTFELDIFEDIIKLGQAKPNTIFENFVSEDNMADDMAIIIMILYSRK